MGGRPGLPGPKMPEAMACCQGLWPTTPPPLTAPVAPLTGPSWQPPRFRVEASALKRRTRTPERTARTLRLAPAPFRTHDEVLRVAACGRPLLRELLEWPHSVGGGGEHAPPKFCSTTQHLLLGGGGGCPNSPDGLFAQQERGPNTPTIGRR